MKRTKTIFFLVLFGVVLISLYLVPSTASANIIGIPPTNFRHINVTDSNLRAQLFIPGLNFPTSMTFAGSDILVVELQSGHIRHFTPLGMEKPLALDLSKTAEFLWGMANTSNNFYVYDTENTTNSTGVFTKNIIYRLIWDGKSLQNPTTVKILGGGRHNGGVFSVGIDGTVYAVNGDAYGSKGVTQNENNGKFDDTSVIVTVNKPGNVIIPSSSTNPLNQYYALGIRNSIGLAVDPVTGILWDSEDGEPTDDELNLVYPNFNSGWDKIMGFATPQQLVTLPTVNNFKYHDPAFDWQTTVAPHGMTFMNSQTLSAYNDNLFVGGFKTGKLYSFKLNSTRTGFVFNNTSLNDLKDNIGDNDRELTFAQGFTGITNLVQGPDGYLYVVDIANGAIYRIIPISKSPPDAIHNLNATVASGNQVNLSWNRPEDGGAPISGYQILRGINGSSLILLKFIPNASTTSFSDTTVTVGSTIKYAVRAVNSIDKAPLYFTAPIKITNATVPAKITNLTLSVVSGNQVNLSWSIPLDGGSPILSYQIFRSLNGGSFAPLVSIGGTLTSYADTTLHPGDSVTYAIKAVNAVGKGSISNIPVLVKTIL